MSYIGTSVFYPKEISKDERLAYSSTFYHLSKENIVKNWELKVLASFFSIKATRYITHQKKLLDFEKNLPKPCSLYSPIARGFELELQQRITNFKKIKESL